MLLRRLVWAVFLVLSFSTTAAERVPARFGESAMRPRSFPAPVLRTARGVAATAVTSLGRVSADEINGVKRWNDAGNLPMRTGVVRALPRALTMEHRAIASMDTVRWKSTVTVEGAFELRLQLTDLRMPPDWGLLGLRRKRTGACVRCLTGP